jgi:putative CocE/NonD family hydrolase
MIVRPFTDPEISMSRASRATDRPIASLRELENIWIPLRDGVRLAARAWLPEDAERHPVSAVLEYIPYRKRDMTALRDTATHGHIARHGYACIRLDARGTGDSEGVYGDQFAAQYVDDAVDAIAWLARQPWCNGDVAMFGLSWGAAIAMQTAARRPPALKTIICAAGIDDRYALRYPGGCLATATVSGVVAQMSYATRPPDPEIVGPRWREMWMERLEAAMPTGETWLANPLRDKAWRADAVADDYAHIACPSLLSAGFADPAFASAMLRTLEGIGAPRLGIFGPWAHRYPHSGIPGPAIDYLGETLRWLDHWLKGRDTGIMREPRLRAWLPTSFTTTQIPEQRPGRWIAVAQWPAPDAAERHYWLGHAGLTMEPQPPSWAEIPEELLISSAAGEFMPLFGSDRGPELAGDQVADDAASLIFDSMPLDAPLSLLGIPSVRLALETDQPTAQIVVRLCEVTPDGRSRRLSWGACNLGLSDDLSARRTAAAGASLVVDIPLYAVAETVAAGNRLRIALSSSYWPLIWPAARSPRLRVGMGASQVLLPLCSGHGEYAGFGEPISAPTLRWTQLRPGGYRRVERREPATGEHVLVVTDDMGKGRIEELGLEISEATTRTFRIRPNHPSSAALTTETTCRFSRDGWSAETSVHGEVARGSSGFATRHKLQARENGDGVFSRSWVSEIQG